MTKETLPRSVLDVVPSAIKIAKLLDQLGELLPAVFAESEVACINGAPGAARAFVVLHRLDDKIDQFSKAYGAQYEVYKTEKIPSALEAAGVTHIPLAEGFRVGVSSRVLASIRKEQKDAAYHWLRANKLGDLITSTVNASTLSAAVKHMIEEDNREPPGDLFNVAVVLNTSVTKTK